MESHVKVMEKVHCELLVENYSSCKNMGVGQSIESEAIEVGGYSFTVRFYPQGKGEAAHMNNRLSLSIKNQSAEAVEVVYAFEFIQQYLMHVESVLGRHSQFHDRGIFRHVTTLEPGLECRDSRFWRGLFDSPMTYVRRDSIRIKTTIGVFVPTPLSTTVLDRTIFFRVGGNKRFFAEESVLRTRCPALLPRNHTDNLVVVDAEPDLFDALLWFIYNGKLERRDEEAIAASRRWSSADSYAVKMLAAADELHLKYLRKICVSIMFHPNLDGHYCCFPIRCALERLGSIMRDGFTYVRNVLLRSHGAYM